MENEEMLTDAIWQMRTMIGAAALLQEAHTIDPNGEINDGTLMVALERLEKALKFAGNLRM